MPVAFAEDRAVERRDQGRRNWRTRAAIGLSAVGLAAIPVALSSGHAAASLPCQGEGGQGAGGYVSSLVVSCEGFVGTVVTTPTPGP